MKFTAVTALSAFTLFQSVAAFPFLESRATKPNIITVTVTETLVTYDIHINHKYKENGVYSWDANWSLTVTNAPTKINLHTSATSTEYSTSISTDQNKGKKTTTTTTITIGGPTSSIVVSDSSTSTTSAKKTTSTSSSSSAQKTTITSPSSSSSARKTTSTSSTSSTQKATSSSTSSTSKKPSTTTTSTTSKKPSSTSTTITTSATPLCNVNSDGPTEFGWENSESYSADTATQCYFSCQSQSSCKTSAFTQSTDPNTSSTCVLIRTASNTSILPATWGGYTIYDAACPAPHNPNPITASAQKCNTSFNNIGGANTSSMYADYIVMQATTATQADCKSLCKGMYKEWCASYVWQGEGYAGFTSRNCMISTKSIETPGVYSEWSSSSCGDVCGWSGVASDVGCA